MNLIKSFLAAVLCFTASIAAAQQQPIQYFRVNDQRGINVYETPKEDSVEFTDIRIRPGGACTMHFQGLDPQNDSNNMVRVPDNFNVPDADLDLDAQLEDGVRLHLRIYLSSRHHEETYVKGGYLQIDKLDFVKKDFMAGFMKHATIKVGQMENNYGDAHFRRTDNAHAIFNPFVGNYIMDSFTT